MERSHPGERGERKRVPLGFGNLYASTSDHIGHFYRTIEEQQSVLTSFLKAGYEAGEKCVCLTSAGRDREEVLKSLSESGIDVEKALATGQMVLDDGKSNPTELRDMLRQALSEIPGTFPFLRWVGVMSWAFKKMATSEKLMEWETHCNTVEDPPAVFLCQYELNMFRGDVVMDALKTHPVSIISNVIHQNPYYESPEAYLGELRRRTPTALG